MSSKRDKIKDSDRFSILTPIMNKCFICGSGNGVQLHEVFYGNAGRVKSKEDGMVAPLCYNCHHGSNFGVHYNKELDLKLKQYAEKIWIDYYTDKNLDYNDRINLFIKRYNKNYLED